MLMLVLYRKESSKQSDVGSYSDTPAAWCDSNALDARQLGDPLFGLKLSRSCAIFRVIIPSDTS
jgi:hypothetical protein